MKQTIKLVAATVIAAVVLFTSCGGGASAPKDVAVKFAEAVGKADFDEAGKYASDETKKGLDMMKAFAGMMPDSLKNKKVEFEVVEEKIDGDNATVTLKPKGGNEKAETFKLTKVDGAWKVNMTKEEMGGGAPKEEPMPVAGDSSSMMTAPADTAKAAAATEEKK